MAIVRSLQMGQLYGALGTQGRGGMLCMLGCTGYRQGTWIHPHIKCYHGLAVGSVDAE